jgi:hypothetical protein
VSGFIHPGATGIPTLVRTDKRCLEEFWLGEFFQPPIILDRLVPEERDYGYGFVNPWWPYAGNLLAGAFGAGDGQVINYAPWYQEPWVRSGCNGRLAFVGYTRDAYGSPIGNCTVRCFRTSTDELVSTVLSDATGFYQATSPYGDAHYLVVHGTGIAGASVSTLVPA